MPAQGTPRARSRLALAAVLLTAACCVAAEDYLGRDEFLHLAFGDTPPAMHTLWLTRDRRAGAEAAVGWAPAALRLRYWQAGERTAWVLEDIGKDKPITLGIVVAAERIERVEVLAFRESRGWEIRYPFFTEQFRGLALAPDGYLSGPVDGITGATLSVRATERVARLALWLAAQVRG
jgi:hypothetical protein